MIFSSVTFLYTALPAMLLLYFLCPARYRNIILTGCGLFLYAWGEPLWVLLLIFTAAAGYTAGRLMEKAAENPSRKRLILTGTILVNLFVLVLFRYAPPLLKSAGILKEASFFPPLGISFYTLQSISYITDLYRGKTRAQHHFFAYTAYVCMFPLCIAGPLVRHEEIAGELAERTVTAEKVGDGAFQFCIGLAKNVLIAGSIAPLWTSVKALVSAGTAIPAVTAWLGLAAFAFRIYFAFSGYSDMACGLGRMLGFSLPQNFQHPCSACSVSGFWKRWHITLGHWFRDYVYIPLGGSRKGVFRTVCALLAAWLLAGLWHGPRLHYLWWGLYFAVLVILEKLVLHRFLDKIPVWLQRILTLFLIIPGGVFFGMETGPQIGLFFQFLVGKGGFADQNSVYLLTAYGVAFLIAILAAGSWIPHLLMRAEQKFPHTIHALKPVFILLVLIVCTAFLVNSPGYIPFYLRF